MKFDRVIIWGHPLHSHTHSYIHNGFYRAFQHLGYETHWLTNSSDISGMSFTNSLFLTEGQVDQNIPLRDDCFYILHNCNEKYNHIQNKLVLQVYTDDVLKYNMSKIEDCIYSCNGGVSMPWATDLLPHEIEKNKERATTLNRGSKVINWVGTIGSGEFGNIEQIEPFKKACQENNIQFQSAFCNKSIEDNIEMIRGSYMAPTIVGSWQQKQGYIPCRIFKNISYGQFGITNSPRVMELFQNKIIYNSDTYQLFYDAQKRLADIRQSDLLDLMDFVKNKHTYLNRIETIMVSIM